MFGRFLKRTDDANQPPTPAEAVLAGAEPVVGKLFEVVGPEDGSCVCDDWVGVVLSIDGADPAYPSLPDAVADGLFHVGCRHTLRAYAGAEAAGRGHAQAQFRTQLAVDLMQRRAEAGQPGFEERFTRLYGWARRAEQAGGPAAAAVLCEAALRLLSERDLFESSRAELERILKARVATIRAQVTNE